MFLETGLPAALLLQSSRRIIASWQPRHIPHWEVTVEQLPPRTNQLQVAFRPHTLHEIVRMKPFEPGVEVFEQIFQELDSLSLTRVARVSKTCHNAAIHCLWEALDDGAHLINLLPQECFHRDGKDFVRLISYSGPCLSRINGNSHLDTQPNLPFLPHSFLNIRSAHSLYRIQCTLSPSLCVLRAPKQDRYNIRPFPLTQRSKHDHLGNDEPISSFRHPRSDILRPSGAPLPYKLEVIEAITSPTRRDSPGETEARCTS
jgi:hypothetical protein